MEMPLFGTARVAAFVNNRMENRYMSLLVKVLELVGGLAFFLYGMNVMSGGLGKVAGGSLERSLKKVTSNSFTAMGLGAGITIAVQSSSAMTVMLVGLVNSGLMSFDETINFIMGSNIGTTVTNWITSLSGIDSNGPIALLQPKNFAPVIAILGVAMIILSKKTRRQDLGKVLVGFAVLMYGMVLMGNSVSGLKDSERFSGILTAFENPLLGVLVSAVFTGVIQSSAATISIVQTLASTGQITYNMAIPLVLGANIGTCATALISSIGVTKEAKKVSVVHITIKIIGTVVCLSLFYGANAAFGFDFLDTAISLPGVALVHTIFNVVNTVILAPFHKQLVAIANFIVRPGKGKQHFVFLDERLLSTPSIAVNEANAMTDKMAVLSRDTILASLMLFRSYSEKQSAEILRSEDELDMYEDKLGTFLVKLSSHSMSDQDSRQVSKMLHTIGDFERLGDHAVNLLRTAQEIHDKKIIFSDLAQQEIDTLTQALNEILELTIDAFVNDDLTKAQQVEPLEQVIDVLIAEVKSAHIERLQSGTCTIQTGFVWSDLLTNYERVSDHCSNVAVALIETHAGSFRTHQYLNAVKKSGEHDFADAYRYYAEKYHVE